MIELEPATLRWVEIGGAGLVGFILGIVFRERPPRLEGRLELVDTRRRRLRGYGLTRTGRGQK